MLHKLLAALLVKEISYKMGIQMLLMCGRLTIAVQMGIQTLLRYGRLIIAVGAVKAII